GAVREAKRSKSGERSLSRSPKGTQACGAALFVNIHIVGQVIRVPEIEHFKDQSQIVSFVDLDVLRKTQVLLKEVWLAESVSQKRSAVSNRFVTELAIEVTIDASVSTERRPSTPLHDRAELQP